MAFHSRPAPEFFLLSARASTHSSLRYLPPRLLPLSLFLPTPPLPPPPSCSAISHPRGDQAERAARCGVLPAPKGFAAHQDAIDRYQFYYPFGWQEVSVRGQDVVFKDVIEPLESVAVNIFPTERASLAEIGPIEQVAQTLVEKVLTAPSQKTKLLDTRVRELDGRTYYDFEFVAQASSYTRHALGTIAIANGKFYTLTTGANERRWSRVDEKLRTVVASFVTL
ncbi:unnamed protein product [Closterium sp. Naga37s-1]|nr:unnamed protein product [Closterium sp. Naga37s-1]